jgi:hypothetical protein
MNNPMGLPVSEKVYLNEYEVSATRGIGLRALRIMRMRGTGPQFMKISGKLGERGGRVLYKASEIDLWIDRQPKGGEQLPVQGGAAGAA